MRAHPVGEGLDESRAAASPSLVDRGLRDRVDGEQVVSVDPDAVHPIGARFLRDRLRGRLLRDGHGDGPLVVLQKKIVAALKTSAKFIPAWKSPSLVAPSPKYARLTTSS